MGKTESYLVKSAMIIIFNIESNDHVYAKEAKSFLQELAQNKTEAKVESILVFHSFDDEEM